MNSLIAFTKKEAIEQLRTSRMMILGILFVLIGIMNPAIAKLTPWMMSLVADSMAESGITLNNITVTAMDSWMQFFKNAPIVLIAFVLIESGIFTKEYQSGTLVLSLTKGLKRYKVVISKAFTLITLWTVGYWLCFGITYFYTGYYWDNSLAQNLGFSAVCWYVFGLWVIGLMTLFSTLSGSNTGVLLGVGGVIMVCYLIGMLPQVSKYLPTQLMDGNSLIYGTAQVGDYLASLLVTAATGIVCLITSIPIFNKKYL